MVTRVVYAIDQVDVIDNICTELASVLVANAARDFRIALVVLGINDASVAVPLEPLTVPFVGKFRNAAIHALSELRARHQLRKPDQSEVVVVDSPTSRPDVSLALKALKASLIEYEELVVVQNARNSIRLGTQEPLLGLKGALYPKKPVKPVCVFDGQLTVGDPESPLLSFGVGMYPATRRAKAPDVATYVDGRKVTHTSVLRTEEGDNVDMESVQRGYMYLRDLVTVDDDLQKLLDGEFEGAEPWPKAFEMLAVVEAVPPWLLMDRTDYVVPKTERDTVFLQTLNQVLLESNNNVLARLCHEPRRAPHGDKKLKGKLELVVLRPHRNGVLTCSRVPFKEEFKSYYEFVPLPDDVEKGEEDLDIQMDALVDAMTTDAPCVPHVNPITERIDDFLIRTISGVEPAEKEQNTKEPQIYPPELSQELINELSSKVAEKFGTKMRKFSNNHEWRMTDLHDDAASSFEFI